VDIVRAPRPKRHRYFLIGGGLAALLLMTYGLRSLEPRAPSVDMATQYTDTVARGPMVREVKAPGTLVPERRLQISAVTPGRVETLPLRPGATVEPGTIIATLSNPDVDLQLLEAQRQLGTAQANLITLRSSLAQQRLQREGAIRQMETEYNNAQRDLNLYTSLSEKNLAAPNEVARARDLERSLAKRLEYEREQLKVLEQSIDAQIAQAQQQVQQNERMVAFQQERQASMTVRASEPGVLQELPLDYGVYVQSGELLARIAKPGELKAELRVPESQAKDIVQGQKASIDTRNGIVPGRVMRVDPIAVNGTVTVEVALEGELPPGARSDMSVDGTIEIDRLADVLYVGRPGYGQPESTISLFKVEPDGEHAVRVQVQLGVASVSTIEVRKGLEVGDRVIISDMTQFDEFDRVRLKK
jgi:HlyD family secretion protein